MKIRITVTLDINPDAWESNYGINRDELREDVRSHYAELCTQAAIECGVLADD